MAGIAVSELTQIQLNGNGVFDKLMSAVDARLAEQHSLNRLTESEYGTIYLNAMQTAMAQAIQFLISTELLDVQRDKILADIELVNSQRDKIAAEILLTQQQLINAQVQKEILELQKDKTNAETDLLTQKVKTEQAQILDTIDGSPVLGSIGKQKGLLQAQTDGFARKAEQDLSKILTDSWSVRRTTDEATIPPNGLKDDDITLVVEKAMAGINI